MLFKFKEEGIRVELAYGILDISEDLYHGYKPEHLLISAIAGSYANTFTKLLDLHHTHIEDFFIRVEVKHDDKEHTNLTQIKLNFVVKGRNLNIDKLQRILDKAREQANVVHIVEQGLNILENIEIVSIK